MIGFDTPSINDLRSPEENIQEIKGWASDLVDELNYQILQLEGEIEMLKAEVASLREVTK